MKSFLQIFLPIALTVASHHAYSQEIGTFEESMMELISDPDFASAGELFNAALECAALADLPSSYKHEYRRLLLVLIDTGGVIFGGMIESLFDSGLREQFDSLEDKPLNPYTGKEFDIEADSFVNLLGFKSEDGFKMFQIGSSFGEQRRRFLVDIPSGPNNAWQRNIDAEFERRNCSLIGK